MTYLLQDYITQNAKKSPESVLIKDGEKQITYGEMDLFTNRCARFLVEKGVQRNEKIAFYMKKNINAFKSIISILKADAVYVPLGIHTPYERIHYMLRHSACKFIICDEESYDKTVDLLTDYDEEITIVVIDQEKGRAKSDRKTEYFDKTKYSDKKREYSNIDVDLAYILYTSGSTGIPKGAMITHRNVIDYAEWTVDYYQVTKDDRLSNHPGLYFDLSTFDLYTAFKSGASLYPVPAAISMFPVKILDFIEKNELTLWNSVPSLLTFVAKSGVLKKGRVPSLKTVTFCGEVMPTKTMIEWMSAYPHIRYINQYGPTETTCASMYYEINEIPKDPTKPIPIGVAIPNTEVFAITEEGKRAKAGEVAELCIRGAGNGMGYLNSPEKTAQSFINNPLNKDFEEKVYATGDLVRLREDGLYDFVGRKDNQIKYMGFRIELGEIESTLDSFDYVTSSAVIGVENEDIGGSIVVAFVQLKKPKEVKEINQDLKEKIPHYMIPKSIIFVERMPLNANGKIDKLALRKQYEKSKGG